MVKAERLGEIRGFIGGLYGPDLHAKRVDSLAGATLGVMAGASLAVSMIGQALAQARGLVAVGIRRLARPITQMVCSRARPRKPAELFVCVPDLQRFAWACALADPVAMR